MNRVIERYFISDGKFSIGGIGLDELLQCRKTPFYVYSTEVIRNKYQRLKSALSDFDIFYSFKPNPNVEVAKVLLNEGAHAEISSGGELRNALDAGFDPANIIFVGPAKSVDDINLAVVTGIFAIVSDSVYEIELIDSIARSHNVRQMVMLRINTLEGPKFAPEIMVGGPGKFGFDEEKLIDELAGVSFGNVEIAGIHIYAASQVMDADVINAHIENVFRVALLARNELRIDMKAIDFGGGFGVPYSDEPELDLDVISKHAKKLLGKHRDEFPGCRFMFEMGRYLVAECGVFITRVERVKDSRGTLYAITDGGMNHFSRPAFMKVRHPVRILNKITEPDKAECTVAGPCCTPIDVIGDRARLPEPEIGDVIGIFNAGAYGYSMSMLKFISFDEPGEYIVDGGEIRSVRP